MRGALLGLRVPGVDDFRRSMALEVGAGGTTICEVEIRRGPETQIRLEPRSFDSIFAEVEGWARVLMGEKAPTDESNVGGELPDWGVSKETIRAIRNMSGLIQTRRKEEGGKSSTSDPAKELAGQYDGKETRELAADIVARMNLSRRLRREISFESGPAETEDALAWLQRTFSEINNGRHPDFTIPARLIITVPTPLLDLPGLDISILDTKGIDQIAQREDIEQNLSDPRAVVVLCSRFNDAPEQACQTLIQRAIEARSPSVAGRVSVLVLHRPEEALAVKDDQGNIAEDAEAGCDLKREQIEIRLAALQVPTMSVRFLNAREDSGDAPEFRGHIEAMVGALRESSRKNLGEIASAVEFLEGNLEEEQTRLAFDHVFKQLLAWMNKHRALGEFQPEVEKGLISQIQSVHWKSVQATLYRRGEWHNLNYYYQLGFGARKLAAKLIGERLDGLNHVVKNLADTPDYADTRPFLGQLLQLIEGLSATHLDRVQDAAKSAFLSTLKEDVAFWDECQAVSGSPYRDKIASRSEEWFRHSARESIRKFLRDQMESNWQEIVKRLGAVLSEFAPPKE